MTPMSSLSRKNTTLIKCGKKPGPKKTRKKERSFYEGRRRNSPLATKAHCSTNVWPPTKGCKYSIPGKGYPTEFLIVSSFSFGSPVDQF